MLEAVRQANARSNEALAAREARYREKLQQANARLAAVKQRLTDTEAEGARLEARFDSNERALDEKTALLEHKIGALKELFGVFQQTASDLIGAFVASPTSVHYPDRDVWLEAFANRMKNASEVTSTTDIQTLWFELLREIHARGEIVRWNAPVHASDGRVLESEVVRLGGFNVMTAEPSPQYLQWDLGEQQLVTMPRTPDAGHLDAVGNYLASTGGLHALSVDPTGGVLLGLLAQKPTTGERVDQGGVVGYMIIAMGLVAFVLAVGKYIDIARISARVADQKRRMDEPRADNSLGRLLQTYRESAHVDAESLQLRLHDCVAKESDRIQRFTVFLVMIASVAPLMGLLGTVVGMINTFQAITLYGTGDPQTMAGGISQALITTVLGLVVAVPAVLLNALVNARSDRVITLLRQQMALLLGNRLEAESRDTSTHDVDVSDHAPAYR
ncbi:MAG: MotA/TolQ/ExbB proton channel family protein [Algiphilus sp.]